MKTSVIRRRFDARERELLRVMAASSGWQEIGGRAMREQSDYGSGGDVIGRTVWIGKPDWAKSAQGANLTEAEIARAVEKAIAGKRLGRKQRMMVEGMLDEIYDMSREAEAPQ